MSTSPLRAARRAAPHTMLHFLILVLQRLVHKFSETAHQNDYVKRCAAANGRCPPSIIAMLFYMECTDVSPHSVVAIPETKKQRIYDSQAARARAQAAAASPSGAVAAAEDAAQVQAAHDAYWQTFAENVMEHLVWPQVRAGIIREAPHPIRHSPPWWDQGIRPIINAQDILQYFNWKGGFRMARNSWYHVCDVLARHTFDREIEPQPFI